MREAGINASSTDRSAAAYVEDAVGIRATAGWFGFRIACRSAETERRVRTVLERYYNVEIAGGVWRLQSKRRLSVMAFGGGVPPTPPTPTTMYLEAAEANSTVSMVSTLTTAPNLEYSTDGVTWQEWQHTTAEGTHTFDVITLGAIGDKVYFRGDNPNGLGYTDGEDILQSSTFALTGAIKAGGNVMSLLDTTMELTEVPISGLLGIFADFTQGAISMPLLTVPDMSTITIIGDYGCYAMYLYCNSLTSAADMPLLTAIGDSGCFYMYANCDNLVLVSDGSLTFDFAPLPITTTGDDPRTYSTANDVAKWMKPSK